MGRNTVQEPTVVAGDHRTSGKLEDRFLKRPQRVHIQVVGRLVQQQQVGFVLQQLGEMDAVSLTSRAAANLLLLLAALKPERGDIRTRRHLGLTELNPVTTAGDLLKHRLGRIKLGARLIDVRQFDGVTNRQLALIRRFLTDNHAEQRGFPGTVGADDPDDATWRQVESQVFVQQLVAEALHDLVGVHHDAAQTRPVRNHDGGFGDLLGLLAVEQ